MFGISTAPAVYSRFIATRMNPLGLEVGQLYLNYIISYNNEVWAHVPQMKLVFNAHWNAGIKLKAKMTMLFRSSIDYLGHSLRKELEWFQSTQPPSEIS